MKCKILKNLFCIISILTFAGACSSSELDRIYEIDPTKFGDVEYMRPSNDVRLNGKILVKSDQKRDVYGRSISIYKHEIFAAPMGRKDVLVDGRVISRRLIDRVVLSESGIGGCLVHFIIVDLRGREPYVTNSFGNNPDGKYCFTIDKIKWGKKETYIYFANGTKYLYPTGEEVFGPVE